MGLHISCRELQSALKERLDDRGFDYDFLWVPVKTEDKRKPGKDIVHGYGWVNFTSPEEAEFAKMYFEEEYEYRNSKYPVKAFKFQGLGELRAHLLGRAHPCDGDAKSMTWVRTPESPCTRLRSRSVVGMCRQRG